MKLNYKNTALGFLDDPKSIDFYVPEAHKPMTEYERITFGESVKKSFPDVANAFKNKVRFVSRSFNESYLKGRSKLISVFDKEEIEESGTLIFNYGSFTNTVFYYLQTSGTGENWNYECLYIGFSKHTQADEQHLDVFVSSLGDITKTFIWEGHYKNGLDHDFFCAWLVGFLCFLRYVELETKIIPAGRKDKHAGEKYVNETKRNIEILDSTWFTTIVRSEGFMVGDETGGFFRLQPYGPGLKDRKLIWIDPFEKKGYTRKAKILTQNEQ